MKTRNIREVKKKFPKISKDVLQETFIQVVTQLGEVGMRLDKLEKTVQGLIYTNADERLMKIESALVLEGELKVVGVDDSEAKEEELLGPAIKIMRGTYQKADDCEKELTDLEIDCIVNLIEYAMRKRLMGVTVSTERLWNITISKLNKMLKEKE